MHRRLERKHLSILCLFLSFPTLFSWFRHKCGLLKYFLSLFCLLLEFFPFSEPYLIITRHLAPFNLNLACLSNLVSPVFLSLFYVTGEKQLCSSFVHFTNYYRGRQNGYFPCICLIYLLMSVLYFSISI